VEWRAVELPPTGEDSHRSELVIDGGGPPAEFLVRLRPRGYNRGGQSLATRPNAAITAVGGQRTRLDPVEPTRMIRICRKFASALPSALALA